MTASKRRLSHEPTSLNTGHATGFRPSANEAVRRHGQATWLPRFARNWSLPLVLAAVAIAAPAAKAVSPEFTAIPALNFSTTVAGTAPLSQVITANSTGASIFLTAVATTN